MTSKARRLTIDNSEYVVMIEDEGVQVHRERSSDGMWEVIEVEPGSDLANQIVEAMPTSRPHWEGEPRICSECGTEIPDDDVIRTDGFGKKWCQDCVGDDSPSCGVCCDPVIGEPLAYVDIMWTGGGGGAGTVGSDSNAICSVQCMVDYLRNLLPEWAGGEGLSAGWDPRTHAEWEASWARMKEEREKAEEAPSEQAAE